MMTARQQEDKVRVYFNKNKGKSLGAGRLNQFLNIDLADINRILNKMVASGEITCKLCTKQGNHKLYVKDTDCLSYNEIDPYDVLSILRKNKMSGKSHLSIANMIGCSQEDSFKILELLVANNNATKKIFSVDKHGYQRFPSYFYSSEKKEVKTYEVGKSRTRHKVGKVYVLPSLMTSRLDRENYGFK